MFCTSKCIHFEYIYCSRRNRFVDDCNYCTNIENITNLNTSTMQMLLTGRKYENYY